MLWVQFVFYLSLFTGLAHAQLESRVESLGQFRFSEFTVSPQLRAAEPRRGGFELRETWMGFEWRRDQSLSAHFSFGSGDLVSSGIWYAQKNEELAFVEALVKAESPYLNFRVGLLPIPFTYEGAYPEWEWSLPATRLRRKSWFTKRDFGVAFDFQTGNLLTSFLVHNGEGTTNLDDRLWYTGLWSYRDQDGYSFLVTAQAGRTGPDSTKLSVANSSDNGFNFDPLVESKMRVGSLALFRKWQRHLVLFEVGRGDFFQNEDKKMYGWAHADFSWNTGGDLNVLTRYEQTQADLNSSATLIKSFSLGLQISSEDRLSSVSMWAVKNKEEVEVNNDEFLIQFRLNSNYLP